MLLYIAINVVLLAELEKQRQYIDFRLKKQKKIRTFLLMKSKKKVRIRFIKLYDFL